ncbi:MAG: hypothetical protein ACTSRQ_14075 [Candidatus Thorarchaeota archaeon]
MYSRKAISCILILLVLSLLQITIIESSASVFLQPVSETHDEDWKPTPDVEKFLNTEWQSPLSKNERESLLESSSKNVWSESCSDSLQPHEDLNKTDAVDSITTLGPQDYPVWSVWPWQDDSHPRNEFSALTTAPNMNGHYWLKKSYSTLAFDIEIDEPITDSVYLWIWLVRNADTYSRFLTIEFDNNQIDRFIIGSTGFKGAIQIPSNKIATGVDRHLVELTINYGGWKYQGWRLEYCWVGMGSGSQGYQQSPVLDNSYPNYPETFTELVPRSGLTDTSVEYKVICGASTRLNIETNNVNDPNSRVVYVYIDNVYKGAIQSPGAYEVSLGNYAPGSQPCILKLVFKNMPNIDYAKRISQLAVHRVGFSLEIDVMEGVPQSTINNQILAMNAWLILHGYHRVSIDFSEELLEDPSTSQTDHMWYWFWFFEHKIYSFWEYVIVVQTLDPLCQGWHGDSGIIDIGIAISNLHSGPTTIWHEYGHHIDILEIDDHGEEDYCTSSKCVMSTNGYAKYYCWYHWHLRIWF